MLRVSYDQAADALYVTLRDDEHVSRTTEIEPGTMVDVDRFGGILGIEVLRPVRSWPLSQVLERFEINNEDAQVLRSLFEAETFSFTHWELMPA